MFLFFTPVALVSFDALPHMKRIVCIIEKLLTSNYKDEKAVLLLNAFVSSLQGLIQLG